MNLKALSNESLLTELKLKVNQERELTTSILHYLREVESRLLFAEVGYSSLYEFCIQNLGYCAGSAHLRISAMRLLKSLPEAEQVKAETKLNDGTFSLSTLSQVHHYTRNEEKTSGQKVEISEKINLLQEVENKSKREVEVILAEKHPTAAPPEKEKVLSSKLTQITFTANEELMENLTRLQELRAHVDANESYANLFYALSEFYLNAKDPMRKKVKEKSNFPESSKQKTKPNKASRYTPSSEENFVWMRDEGQCTYINPITKKACGTKFGLQLDHILPHALGGQNTADNLRLRCAAHNALYAKQVFGENFVFRTTHS